jgi:NADH-quinone oxidoreductase subunit C
MTSEAPASLIDQLKSYFGDTLLSAKEALGQYTIELAPERLLEVAKALRDERAFRFEQLIDLCGVDYLGYGQDEWETDAVTSEGFSRGVTGLGPGRFAWNDRPRPAGIANRFAVVVHLLSIEHNRRLRLRYFAADDTFPVVPSLVDIWGAANWFEREAFDLFGIVFEGHPDLRRILTDYGFIGHPLRKDFPLIGNVEVRYDPDKGRVIYEPVSIEPRVGVPRVIREDSRWLQAQNEAAGKAN